MKWWIGLAMVALWGVSSVFADGESDAKAFKTPKDQANVYLARKTDNMGALLDFQIMIDGAEVAKLANGTFSNVLLESGTHKIEIHAGVNTTSMDIKVAPGKLYFYQLGPKAKKALLEPEMSLVILEPMGKLMVSQSKYVAPSSAAPDPSPSP